MVNRLCGSRALPGGGSIDTSGKGSHVIAHILTPPPGLSAGPLLTGGASASLGANPTAEAAAHWLENSQYVGQITVNYYDGSNKICSGRAWTVAD